MQSPRSGTDPSRSSTLTAYDKDDDVHSAMPGDIGGGTVTIGLRSYIIPGDAIGWRLATALARQRRASVRVWVRVDGVGAPFEGTEKLFRYPIGARVVARWFNRWRWTDPRRCNRRNHRKLLVVDGRSVYLTYTAKALRFWWVPCAGAMYTCA